MIKRKLGQNFLTGSHYPQRIIDAVSPVKDERIIEIGPGRGALTGLLIESGANVTAIEIDAELISYLIEKYSGWPNFRLIEADALEVDFCSLTFERPARVVANLPYYISTPILQRLIEHRRCISEMTLMLQREVVERMTAHPGGKEHGFLSVLVQFYCSAEKLFDVPPGAFRPSPKIHSSVVRLKVRERTAAQVGDERLFIDLTKTLYAHRRKTVFNNLRAGGAKLGLSGDVMIIDALNNSMIDPKRRAETLSIEEIARLANRIYGIF